MVTIPLAPALVETLRPEKSAAQKSCEGRGGTWDTATKTCSIPERPKKTEPTPPPVVPPITKLTPEEKANAQLRNETIVTDRFGNESILTEEERLRRLAEFGGIGAAEALETKEATARRGAVLAAQVGVEAPIGELEPTELAGTEQTRLVAQKGAVDLAVTRGLQFAGGAAAASIVGGVTAPAAPVAGAIGGAVGIVFGAIEGYYKARSDSITSQASGFVGAKAKTLRSTKTVMTRSLSNAWGGRGDKEDSLIMFNKGWNDGLVAYEQLQVDTQNDVQLRRGVDGTTTLQMYLEFYKDGGQGQQFREELELALVSAPDLERSIFWTNQADINELVGAQ